MKTMLSYSDNQGRRFFATSQDAMTRFAAKQAEIETLVYAGSQQVRMDLLNRIARGVYQSKYARRPFVVSVRRDGNQVIALVPYTDANGSTGVEETIITSPEHLMQVVGY